MKNRVESAGKIVEKHCCPRRCVMKTKSLWQHLILHLMYLICKHFNYFYPPPPPPAFCHCCKCLLCLFYVYLFAELLVSQLRSDCRFICVFIFIFLCNNNNNNNDKASHAKSSPKTSRCHCCCSM